MRMLQAIYFINSANIPYAEIRLDGNVHIAGVNGVGKSTILRAILFFYNANTRNLGIENHQQGFSEFYLKFSNSYIVYEILKENEVYLAIVLKSQNRACFRFVKTPFLKELFLDEHHRAKSPQEIVQSFNAQKLFHSPMIERQTEFKDIIYGTPVDLKFRAFSLFESKNYENIPRTIANIFLNYKLESDFIKKSIIYSLVEDERLYQINLLAIQEPLGKIERYLADIDLYSQQEQLAHTIVAEYERIIIIEADKYHLAIQLGSSVKFAEIEKKDIEGKITLLQTEISKVQTALNDLERQFSEKRDTLIRQIGIVEYNLKEARKKFAYYQEKHIEDILEKVSQKAFHEKSLDALQQQKALLLKKAQHIEMAFNAQINKLQQDQRELIFKKEQEKLQVEKVSEQEKRSVEEQYRKKIREKNDQHQQRLAKSNELLDKVKKIIQNLELQRKDIEHSRPFQSEIRDLEVQRQETQRTLHKHEVTINEKKAEIVSLEKDITHKQREGENKHERCQESYQRQHDKLQNDLNRIIQKLQIAEDSFLSFLERTCPAYKETIAKVCREEIFSMTDLSPKILDPSQLTLFGVMVDLEKLDSVILEREEYESQKRDIEQRIQEVEQQHLVSISEIRQEVDQFVEEQRKLIGKLNKAIAGLEKEDRENEFHLQRVQQKITELKEKETDQKRQELEKIDVQLLDERGKQRQIEQDIKRQEEKYSQDVNTLEMEKEQSVTLINVKLKQQCEQLFQQQQVIEHDYQHHITELEIEKKDALQNEGVDLQKVAAVEQGIKALEEILMFIKENEPIVAVYQENKKDFIDKIPEFEQQKAELTRKKKELTQHYDATKGKISAQKQEKENSLITKQTRTEELARDLKEFDEFKLSPLYAELRQQIEESSTETNESISHLIRQLEQKDQNFQRKRNLLLDAMTEFSGKFRPDNIFNFRFNRSDSGEQGFREFAQDVQDFVEERRIETFKREVNVHYGQLMRDLSKKFNDLNSKAGDIQKAITRINQDFERSNFVGAIKKIQLRFKESGNTIVNTLKHIAEFVSENPFAGEELNLFNQQTPPNQQKDSKAVDLLNHLRKELEKTSQQVISLEDSFKLEFRVIENENDTNFVEKLSRAGSEGTDILIKAMIYITLLDVAKEQFSKRIKEYKIHCIIDEVGKLANNYLKELIAFANSKNIFLINGSPNMIDPLAYHKVYHISKDRTNNSVVKRLLAEKQ
ncbi:hypothetical protein U14_05724 [Candidatus Moduliflexus flocculans]|uniref:ATP-binding protein n=1 Tax=Candidatus Moduliflexus flocculans TaxID=1499966 RepID=A0A081BSQ8_9BACT|nr:hypothetical protein U14_05724 [Candidatus Moduliflexus flocculans]